MRHIDLGDPGFWMMQLPVMCLVIGGTIFGLAYGLVWLIG